MKRLIIPTFLALVLAACGPKPEPTLSAADVQGTAVAAAWTMVAETQAAIPTATPIPPTETPSPTPIPTNTVAALPTQPIDLLPTATLDSGKDECDQVLQADVTGPTFPLKIMNETKAPVTVSVYLYKTPFGECGYRGYSLSPNDSTVVTFLQGNISAYAWINDTKKPSTASGGIWHVNNPDKWTIHIYETYIKMVGP